MKRWLALLLLLLCLPATAALAQDDELEDEELFGTLEEEEEEEDEDEDEGEAEDEEAYEDEEGAEEEGGYELGSESEGRALDLVVAAGIGVGTRAFERPTAEGGLQRLPDAAFPAAEVLARAHVWPDDSLSLEALLAYQTSIGLAVHEQPPFALPEQIDVRSARAEISVGPSLRLGDSPDAARLVFPVGFMLRLFTPAVDHFRTPGYALGGPHARVELVARLGDAVDLRIGPEAQWIVLIDGTIRDNGVCCQGVAVGGQGALDARISDHLAIGIAFRQAHAFAPSTGAQFLDVERLVTTRLYGRL